MKKRAIISMVFGLLAVTAVGGLFFYQRCQAAQTVKNQPRATNQSVEVEKPKDELATFETYNEELVYDIYFFSPEDDNEEKRLSLGERMTQPLVDQMCPAIPELTEQTNQAWNEILAVKTVEVNELAENKRESVTDYTIKTSQGQSFALRSRAVYEKQGAKWIMTDILPEQREA